MASGFDMHIFNLVKTVENLPTHQGDLFASALAWKPNKTCLQRPFHDRTSFGILQQVTIAIEFSFKPLKTSRASGVLPLPNKYGELGQSGRANVDIHRSHDWIVSISLNFWVNHFVAPIHELSMNCHQSSFLLGGTLLSILEV